MESFKLTNSKVELLFIATLNYKTTNVQDGVDRELCQSKYECFSGAVYNKGWLEKRLPSQYSKQNRGN